MSNQKFTDWRVMRKGGRIEINMGGSSIALADTPENLGIAVFIAAAPEMYEALADITENCGNHGCSETCAEADCKICEILKKARGEA